MELNACILSIWINNFYMRLNENTPVKSNNGVLIPPNLFHWQEVAAPSFLASVFLSRTRSIPHMACWENPQHISVPESPFTRTPASACLRIHCGSFLHSWSLHFHPCP